MEQINIGDTVRFLNDVGGGKVTGFQKGGIVLVEDEDGFEVPVRQSEVCLVSSSENKLKKIYAEEPKEEPLEQPTYRVKTILATAASNAAADLDSYSSNAMPSQPATREQKPSASPAYSRDELREIEMLSTQVLQLQLEVNRLTKRLERLENAKSLREKLKESGMKLKEDNRRKKDDIIEIDLHAEEILDTTVNMSAADIKTYQLDIFRRTMDEHRNEKGRRIVFIHGNGEGVLRKSIIDELRRSYKSCEYQDASFQQYGFGATMVIIH